MIWCAGGSIPKVVFTIVNAKTSPVMQSMAAKDDKKRYFIWLVMCIIRVLYGFFRRIPGIIGDIDIRYYDIFCR